VNVLSRKINCKSNMVWLSLFGPRFLVWSFISIFFQENKATPCVQEMGVLQRIPDYDRHFKLLNGSSVTYWLKTMTMRMRPCTNTHHPGRHLSRRRGDTKKSNRSLIWILNHWLQVQRQHFGCMPYKWSFLRACNVT
jgi:hypothetical protein